MAALLTLLPASPLGQPRRCFLAIFALLLGLLLASPLTLAVTQAQGKSIRPLHGAGYEHLDCSACLTVATTLFHRLNRTLSEKPSTYLISHRLSKQNQQRWHQYRNSDLLVADVMEGICDPYKNDIRLLRLHPKSKVRLYHQQSFGDAFIAVRHALREDEVFPADADPSAWAEKQNASLYPMATLYSRKDVEGLHRSQRSPMASVMCALLVEEFEEEIEELVKAARTHSDMEYGLCGMAPPLSKAVPTHDEATAEGEAGSVPFITNVCANVEVLRAAAGRDQQRWQQFQRRLEKKRTDASRRRGSSTTATAAKEPTGDAATNSEAATVSDQSAPAAPGEPAVPLVEETLDSSVRGDSANAFEGDTNDDL
ncbi:hypothetical protein LSCM1_01850 [Leishmania martiniquensis]|uniref:DUF3456 domain-containing protein n=1 Tax=Leishmania martiniquensis TaxID=1580590 RepID=A0A836GED9_9TRYP|nr:hypothetical protein LSCM1_01850 [Leishmania martiniquensis]